MGGLLCGRFRAISQLQSRRHPTSHLAAHPAAAACAPVASSPTAGVQQEDDINAELGVGSVAADAELDAMKEGAERQILGAARSLLGPYARLVSAGARRAACCMLARLSVAQRQRSQMAPALGSLPTHSS